MQDKVVLIIGATGGSGSALTHRLTLTGTRLVPYFSSVVGLQLMSALQIQPRRAECIDRQAVVLDCQRL